VSPNKTKMATPRRPVDTTGDGTFDSVEIKESGVIIKGTKMDTTVSCLFILCRRMFNGMVE
jgi:hypothetical protein